MQDADPLVGAVLGDKLPVRVVRRLGEGGMGTVYLAESTATGLPYAVKVLQRRLCHSEGALRRFFREALAASSIRHPGVVSVVDTGSLRDGTGYYVMEFLAGEDLSRTLARERRLAWPRVRHIALQVCDTMAVVHAHAIVHRDLKPANCVRMTRGADPDAIKILDFGVAKISLQDTSALTGEGAFLGTVAYMAPELLRSNGARDGDARGDIWAVGVMIHELLTGTRPFRGENVFQLMAAIQDGEPAPLTSSTGEPDWPDALLQVLARALAKDPEQRFADMRALATALQGLSEAPTHRGASGSPVVDASAPTAAAGEVSETVAVDDTLQQIRERAAFYVNPASRWRPQPYALPGGGTLVVMRSDLALEDVDAVVCGIGGDGPVRGTLARDLCEFGGPELTAAAFALPHASRGSVHAVAGGRLGSGHVLFAQLPDEFSGIRESSALMAKIVANCLDRARAPEVHSLAIPLLLSGAFGLPQRVCLEVIVTEFCRALAAAPPLTLGILRVVIDDGGARLARYGELTVELPDTLREHERVQRFVLRRYPTMHALGAAICSSIPAGVRPALADYGASWTLRRADSGRPIEAALLLDPERRETPPAEVGLTHGARLRLTLHAAPRDDGLRSG